MRPEGIHDCGERRRGTHEATGFALRRAADVLENQRIDLDIGEYLELWPHRHGTDGFFAAVFERTA